MTRRNTRELILETSLKLFNQHGQASVTTNRIADESEISPGNLYYHFRSKNDIILELFKRFAIQLDAIIDVPDDARIEAEDLWFQLHLVFELKGRYRFLFRNIVGLTDRIPDLGRAFRGLFQRERAAAESLISKLCGQGKMSIDETEREILLSNLMLALIYWIPYAEMFGREKSLAEDSQVKAIAGVLQMLMPYLNDPERKQFGKLADSYLSALG